MLFVEVCEGELRREVVVLLVIIDLDFEVTLSDLPQEPTLTLRNELAVDLVIITL